MNSRLLALIVLLLGLVYWYPVGSDGTIPPEDHALRPLPSGKNPIDPELERWFQQYASQPSIMELSAEAFTQKLQDWDSITRAFLRLRYANVSGVGEQQAVAEALALLKATDGALSKDDMQHPLKSYFLEELIQSSATPSEVNDYASALLSSEGGRSCPHKEAILREISAESFQALKDEDYRRVISRINSFRARRFREEAFERLLGSLPEERKELLASTLTPILLEFPKLIESHDWLIEHRDPDGASKSLAIPTALQQFSEAQASIRQRRCTTAFDQMQAGLAGDRHGEFYGEAEKLSEQLAACFRRSSNQARLSFWEKIEPHLLKTYGFTGRELAQRRQGLIHWSADRFDRANKIFEALFQESLATKDRVAAANSLYHLARIAENEGKVKRSIEYYQRYVDEFADQQNNLDSLMSLVLLTSLSQEVERALEFANRIIVDQTARAVDARDGSVHSFALFWAGRLHVMLGQKALAIELWRRVASEYYSTFYGAMGHFMLEQLTGVAYRLEPSRSLPFRFDQLVRRFDYDDQITIRRARSLLELGFRREAACEIAELDMQESTNDKVLARALFLYATGEWLEAIKAYNSLPVTYRGSLPIGSEQILFPKAYENLIDRYSGQLGVDPDIVLAIIRQESVFNPRAHSVAGARGVMQLMPATARLEAGRLQRSYLTASHRQQIQREVTRTNALFDPDLNIALGVHHFDRLMRRYKNPIFVLTSYNANPRATERWMRNIPTDDFLIFVERIPYQETKLYVKLVLRNYFYYKRWYRGPEGGASYLEPLLTNDLKRVATLQESHNLARPPRG